MRLGIFIYDGMTLLDAIGGYDVLARLPGMETNFFAEEEGLIAADIRSAGLVASASFETVGELDILYVPGGPGVNRVLSNKTALEAIAALDGGTSWTVGICNGVGILGGAGVLKRQSATTNYFYREQLADMGVRVVPDRYHRSGKYVTGAGVSASIDTGLYLAGLIAGEAAGKTLQLGIEYYPDPPFPEASPEEAPEPAKAMVRAFEEMSPKLMGGPPAFAGKAFRWHPPA